MNTTDTRILIADDDPDAADTTADLFRLMGYQTQAVYDGRHAVELARSFLPDVAILDVNMPRLDGNRAAAILRSEFGARIVLIAHSAQTDTASVERSRASGFDSYLVKPADTGLLQSVVATALTDREGDFPVTA